MHVHSLGALHFSQMSSLPYQHQHQLQKEFASWIQCKSCFRKKIKHSLISTLNHLGEMEIV